jgi:hypothetical protein
VTNIPELIDLLISAIIVTGTWLNYLTVAEPMNPIGAEIVQSNSNTKTNLFFKQKLDVPDRNIEPAIATTPGIDYTNVQIHREPELKGAFKALQQKGLRIKDYKEYVG